MPELYEVVDARPIAEQAPYTFFLPSAELLAAIGEGDLVKAMIRAVPPSEKLDAERMWVRVSRVEEEWLVGHLESKPFDMPLLEPGATIRFLRSSVLDVLIQDESRCLQSEPARRQYWERCLVDRCVLDGILPVGYLYRETPDVMREGDKFPDSGWRIRGDMRGVSSEELAKRKMSYVALGAVLNKDDSWLHLIDEPVDAEFEKDFSSGKFVRTELGSTNTA